jgi:queuine tRNA-ribosyltransferase
MPPKETQASNPAFEIVQHPNGTASVREVSSGQTMHSVIGAWEEAELLYVEQSGLAQRFLLSPELGPVRVLDVGMGIAANALCALECREQSQGPRPLHLLSFEHDVRGLELALSQPDTFAFLGRHREKIETLLEKKEWHSPNGKISWRLWVGDFFENVSPEMEPEVVFYDFYAPRSCPELWSVGSLAKVRALGAPRQTRGLSMDLYTYSAGTPIRVALLLAGFFVGYGTKTPSKAETTIASTRLENLERPLGEDWLKKLERSDRPYPWMWPEQDRNLFQLLTRVRMHPQFSVRLAQP